MNVYHPKLCETNSDKQMLMENISHQLIMNCQNSFPGQNIHNRSGIIEKQKQDLYLQRTYNSQLCKENHQVPMFQ